MPIYADDHAARLGAYHKIDYGFLHSQANRGALSNNVNINIAYCSE